MHSSPLTLMACTSTMLPHPGWRIVPVQCNSPSAECSHNGLEIRTPHASHDIAWHGRDQQPLPNTQADILQTTCATSGKHVCVVDLLPLSRGTPLGMRCLHLTKVGCPSSPISNYQADPSVRRLPHCQMPTTMPSAAVMPEAPNPSHHTTQPHPLCCTAAPASAKHTAQTHPKCCTAAPCPNPSHPDCPAAVPPTTVH